MATISNLLYEDPEEIRRKMIEMGIVPPEMEPPPFQGDVRALMRESEYPVAASQFQGDARALMREPSAYPQTTTPIAAILQPEAPIAPAQPEYSFKPGTVTKLSAATSDAERKARDKAFMEALQAQDAQFRRQEMPAKDLQGMMQQVMAMAQPGYKTRSSDPAYSSMVYERGMPIEQIMQTPQYKMLQSMGPMFKQQAEIDKMRAEAEKARMTPSATGDGSWREMKVDGKVYRINSKTGDIQPATVGGGEQLTETKEKKDDSAKALAGIKYAEGGMREIENVLGKIVGADPTSLGTVFGEKDLKRVREKIDPATGWVQGGIAPYVTTPFQAQEVADIRSQVERLKMLAQTYGVSALKQAGVSPGSITEKEWPKFAARLANIDLAQSEEAMATELADIWRGIQRDRAEMAKERDAMIKPSAPAANQGGWAIRPK